MKLNRRTTLALGLGAAAIVALPVRFAAAATGDEMIAAFTGGAAVAEGGVTITAPEIAENGNTVPVAVASEGAVSILILAMGNPTPGVATFNFGEAAGAHSASTRIRLAGTQDVVAIAKMADGSFTRGVATVKVTIGGCGG